MYPVQKVNLGKPLGAFQNTQSRGPPHVKALECATSRNDFAEPIVVLQVMGFRRWGWEEESLWKIGDQGYAPNGTLRPR